MNPNFTLLLISTVIFALLVLLYIRWRFNWADALVFVITTGLFSAIMDFISSFVVHNYVYPGKSQLWVFTFIFFGWISVCGSCLFIAEGILAHRGKDIVSQRKLWWQVPLLTGIIAVVLDLFIDPIAVEAGYWVWSVKGTVYYEIPLLNFVGWFVLMFIAALAWILIIRKQEWNAWRKIIASLIALIPMVMGSGILSFMLNSMIGVLGVS
ncbi:MAG: carotenoid biosynthesis protein [Bacteroidales bacterium]